ncbi:MAG: hypothetical protein BIFFINMI_00270 [Phycisphaerae bacterium]|nr:hypothetical protein [Phycisphaerae bacterium]
MCAVHRHSVICPICGVPRPPGDMLPGETVREAVAAAIMADHPAWTREQAVCSPCLNGYRAEYVRQMLEEEKGELNAMEEEVLQSLRDQDVISENLNEQFEGELTFGERAADRLADFGGSWTFIISFAVFLLGWMAVNALALWRQWDPYPFILLNLVLSTLAALQAPVIMMSQKRQDAKDRLRSEQDYRVNLMAELQVRLLHMKVDQLLNHQWRRLLEIQQVQMDLMRESVERRDRRK